MGAVSNELERKTHKQGLGKAAEQSCQGCFWGCVCLCVCVNAKAGVDIREFEGSLVNPRVMLALALLCRGHPLSFVSALSEVE